MAQFEVSITFEYDTTVTVEADSYQDAEDIALANVESIYVVDGGFMHYWHSIDPYDVTCLDPDFVEA